MIQEEIRVTVIKPAEGYKLTQAGEVKIENRVISERVFLAVNDSVDNWTEITDAEAEEILKQQQKEVENETV